MDPQEYAAEEDSNFGELATLEALGEHRATLVFVHGLGFNVGSVWAERFVELRKSRCSGEDEEQEEEEEVKGSGTSSAGGGKKKALQEFWRHTKFVFPTAPPRKMWFMKGELMHGWYNVVGEGPRTNERCPGIETSANYLHSLIATEAALLSKSSNGARGSKNVILGGFSQGGTMTTIAGHTCPHPLGALLALSGYVCSQEDYFVAKNYVDAQKDTPYVIVQGTTDDVVLPEYGDTTNLVLSKHREGRRMPVYHVIEGLPHEVTDDELDYIFQEFGILAHRTSC